MRITYLLAESLVDGTGVAKKIAAQVAAWEAAGHHVDVVSLDRPGQGLGLLRAFDRAVRTIDDAPGDLGVVYFRQNAFVPALLPLMARVPVVMEVNSDDRSELAGRRRGYRLWHRATRGLVLRRVAGVVLPTHELAERLQPLPKSGARRVISNGVDLETSPVYEAPEDRRSRAVFTYTSPAAFPGVDLVVRLAAAIPEVAFDIVGPVPPLPVPANVTTHGVLTGTAYDRIVGRADVGIGSLGMHRIGLAEGSTLKVRGYLAAGIPTILAHRDTDFPDGAPFLLRLEPTEAIERHADRVRAFVGAVKGTRVARADVAHLDVRHKEKQRLDFMESCRWHRK